MVAIIGFDLEQHNPALAPASPALPISCAVTIKRQSLEEDVMRDWYSTNHDPVSPKTLEVIDGYELNLLVDYLENQMDADSVLTTWHGAAYDLACLAYHLPDRVRSIRQIALASVDLHLLFMAVKRHRLGLKAAAAAVGSSKGGGDIKDGGEASAQWPEQWEAIIAYCRQDVRATLDVYTHLRTYRHFTWRSSKGRDMAFDLPANLHDPATWTVEHLLKNYRWPTPERWITEPCSSSDAIFDWLRPSLQPRKLVRPVQKQVAQAQLTLQVALEGRRYLPTSFNPLDWTGLYQVGDTLIYPTPEIAEARLVEMDANGMWLEDIRLAATQEG